MNKEDAYHYNLTEREFEVTNLIAQGLKNREIAEKLHLSMYTIKAHRRNIYKKFGCSNLISFLKVFFKR